VSLWRAAFYGARGVARTSNRIGESAAATIGSHQAQRIPRAVARRGYLVPGDPTPPPGLDFLDYRGLTQLTGVSPTSAPNENVTLGRSVDLRSGVASGSVRVPVSQFFKHVAVVAPPGSGKTHGVIVPLAIRLLRAGASVVVLDVTGALGPQLREYSKRTAGAGSANVRSMEWTLHPGRASKSWNPLAGVTPTDLVAIEGLKSAIAGDEPPDPRHRDFHDRDLRVLGIILRAVLGSDGAPSLAGVAGVLSDRSEFGRVMGRSPSGAALGWEEVSECWTLRNKLEVFQDPSIRSRTATAELRIEDVCNDHTLAIIGAELEMKSISQAASALFVNRLMGYRQGLYNATNVRPLVFIVDEAPVVAKRIDLAGILATARASSTGLVLACQNVTQFGTDEEQSTVFDACDTVMLLPGASEGSIRRFQARLGQRDVDRVSLGAEVGHRHRVSHVERSSERVAVIGDRELLQPPFGRWPAVVHSRSLSPQPFVLDLDRTVEIA
jgi:hypothetical protein